MNTSIEELITFLISIEGHSSFAYSLVHGQYGYNVRGYLTPNQTAAAERLQTEYQEKAEIQAHIEGEEDTGLDLSSLPAGRYAVPDGATRLKVLVRKPGKNSNWQGYIFVSNAAVYGNQARYGMQAPGKNYSGRIQTQLRAIMADPQAASLAYGRLTGTCGICGRTLEDENSVARGIGPICAGKLGWDDTPSLMEL